MQVVPRSTRPRMYRSQSDGTRVRKVCAATPLAEPATVFETMVRATAVNALSVADSIEKVTPAVEAAGAMVALSAGTVSSTSTSSCLKVSAPKSMAAEVLEPASATVVGSAKLAVTKEASRMFRANSLGIDQRVRDSVSRMLSVAMIGIPSYSVGVMAMLG